MNAIISFRTQGIGENFFSWFGYTFIRKKKFQEVPGVIHLFLPTDHPREQKVLKKTKKILDRYGIKQILPEQAIKDKYGSGLKEAYDIADGRRMMLSRLQERMHGILRRYGFQKGKVRILIECEDLLQEMAELLKAHQQYLQFIVFSGRMTPQKQRIAEMFYGEFGINTVVTQQPEQMECNLLLLGEDREIPLGNRIKLVINVSGRPVETDVPVVSDLNIEIPREFAGLDCRRVELCQIAEAESPFRRDKK